MQLWLDLYSFPTSPTPLPGGGGIKKKKKERDVVERRSFLTGLPVISDVGRPASSAGTAGHAVCILLNKSEKTFGCGR